MMPSPMWVGEAGATCATDALPKPACRVDAFSRNRIRSLFGPETPTRAFTTLEHSVLAMLSLPFAFTCGFAALVFLPSVRQNPRLLAAFLGAAALLGAWILALLLWTRRTNRPLQLEVVLRKQHYLQACVQGSVLLYWGWYWPQVYASAHLILAQ